MKPEIKNRELLDFIVAAEGQLWEAKVAARDYAWELVDKIIECVKKEKRNYKEVSHGRGYAVVVGLPHLKSGEYVVVDDYLVLDRVVITDRNIEEMIKLIFTVYMDFRLHLKE